MPEITFMVRISSWNYVRVPIAWLLGSECKVAHRHFHSSSHSEACGPFFSSKSDWCFNIVTLMRHATCWKLSYSIVQGPNSLLFLKMCCVIFENGIVLQQIIVILGNGNACYLVNVTRISCSYGMGNSWCHHVVWLDWCDCINLLVSFSIPKDTHSAG